MNSISVLKNPVMEYAWGSQTAIPELLGLQTPSEKPAAELWLGAHAKAPSRVLADGRWQALNEVIAHDPVSVLGKAVAERFSNRLPFLFKVLAADQPLSIQVHPNLDQAREGFERENRLGIPFDATDRNYRDANHKPEFLCAVTPFEALKGFRTPQEIRVLMGDVCGKTLAHELDRLRISPDSNGLRLFLSSLLGLDASRKRHVVESAVHAARDPAVDDRAFWWICELNRTYPGDIGVLSPLIFNVIELTPGEGIFIRAGELHAYLKGVGMELMANSDNVLRGGLTPKHVDVPELLKIVDFNPSPVRKILPQPGAPGESVYRTPAEEFQLSVIHVSNNTSFASETNRGVELLICMEGRAVIRGLRNGEAENVGKGKSVMIPAALGPYQIAGKAVLFRATAGI